MKTFSPKKSDIKREWHVIDASQAPLGRISTVAARLLIGKDKPSYSTHADMGDFVVVINAESLVATGDKLQKKEYFRHSPYPGGLSVRTLSEQLQRDPKKVIMKSVRGMLPVNKLRKDRINRLKVYAGAEHNHVAQNPTNYDLKAGK